MGIPDNQGNVDGMLRGVSYVGTYLQVLAVFQISHAHGHAMRQDAFWDEKH